jgi:hypothetical protein
MEQLYDLNHIALRRHHRYQNPNAKLLRHFQHSPQLRYQKVGILKQQTHATPSQEGIRFWWQMEVNRVLVGTNVEKTNVNMPSSCRMKAVKKKLREFFV